MRDPCACCFPPILAEVIMPSIWAAAGGSLLPVCPSQGYNQLFAEPRHVEPVYVEMNSSVLQCLLLLWSKKGPIFVRPAFRERNSVIVVSSKTDIGICARVDYRQVYSSSHLLPSLPSALTATEAANTAQHFLSPLPQPSLVPFIITEAELRFFYTARKLQDSYSSLSIRCLLATLSLRPGAKRLSPCTSSDESSPAALQ